MFSDNDQISIRQVFRLYVFDFIGVSTLILPSRLSAFAGMDGLWSIALGGGIGSLYLWYLAKILQEMDTDLVTFMQRTLSVWSYRLVMAFLVLHCIVVAGYGAYVFADVMKIGLVTGESFHLLLVLVLLVAGYAVCGGVESRARVYEILFWVLFVPLILMFLLAIRDVELNDLMPVCKSGASVVTKGAILVFDCLTPLFLVLLFPVYVKKEKRKKMVHAVLSALWFALGVLSVLYVILVGSFGSNSLASMRYPAVTLMSSIHLRGSFLKRLDAFMLGIWFFTLFALLNVFLFFGQQLFCKAAGEEKKGKRRIIFLTVLLLVFIAAEIFSYTDATRLFLNYMCYLATPLLVVLPAVLLVFGKCLGKVGKKE